MNPDPSTTLRGIVRAYAADVIPALEDANTKNSVYLGNGLLNVLAVEFERLIDRLLEETTITCEIIRDASALLEDEKLAVRARAAAAKRRPADYRLSTVQALNDAAREMLIEVHAAIEATAGEAAAAINERIWNELQASTVRRQTRSNA